VGEGWGEGVWIAKGLSRSRLSGCGPDLWAIWEINTSELNEWLVKK